MTSNLNWIDQPVKTKKESPLKKATSQTKGRTRVIQEGCTDVFIAADNSQRDAIQDAIARDLKAGKLKSLTVAVANRYGLKTRNNIHIVQHELRTDGLLEQRGNRFLTIEA